MANANFTKPARSIQTLIELLQSRGLPLSAAEDIALARKALSTYGYYRLTGYMLPFQQGGISHNKHNFKHGATIQKILSLYAFDSALRQHSLEALEHIEIAFRTTVCDHLSRQHGAHWLLKQESFKPGKHQSHLETLAEAAEYDIKNNRPFSQPSGNHDFITQYYKRYSNPPIPPGWMIRECATFRVWAYLFHDLNPGDQKQITDQWKYPTGDRIDHTILSNWIHSLSIFRNRCAHHSRITYRKFPFAPTTPKSLLVDENLFTDRSNDDLRTLLVVIAILLKSVIPSSMWLRHLYLLLDRYSAEIDIQPATGFQENWQIDPLWSI